ncbi:MAG: hypothetical protein ACLTEH_04460, partial [Clostridia bacterium]
MRSGKKVAMQNSKKKKEAMQTKSKENKFNFDQEIVIGVTKIPEQEKQKKKDNSIVDKNKKKHKT